MPSMTIERTSGHRALGLPRLAAVSAIHCIVPCWPAATKAARRSGASGIESGEATATLSKPSRLASRSMKSRRLLPVLEIEVRIMRHRRQPAHAIAEQRAEGRPRLQPRIPVARRRIFGPVDLAEIVEDRNRRRRGEIG